MNYELDLNQSSGSGKVLTSLVKKIIIVCLMAFVLIGCQEEDLLFEKRYVMIDIPGYDTDDYIELMNSDDPDACYLGIAYLIKNDLPGTDDQQLKRTIAARAKILMKGPSAKVRAISAVLSGSLGDPEFEELLADLLTDKNSAVKVDALFTLAKFPELSDQTIEAVIRCFDDENVLVRLQALETARVCKSTDQKQKATARILTKLDDSLKFEQFKRIEALGYLEHDAAKQTLLSLLDSDDSRIVNVAIAALGKLGSKEAGTPLLRLLAERQYDVDAIVGSLAHISPDVLIKLLDNKDEGVRIAAIKQFDIPLSQEALKIVIGKLERREPLIWDKLKTVEGKNLGSDPEFSALLELLMKQYMESGDGKEFNSELIKYLTSTKLHKKLLAMIYLSEDHAFDLNVISANQPSPDYVSALIELSRDSSPVIRLFAVTALGNSVDERTEKILLGGLDDEVFAVQYASINAGAGYVSHSGKYDVMAKVYGEKDRFIPTTFDDEDVNLAIRQLIERVIENVESSRVAQQRHLTELSANNTRFTRLQAAAALCGDEKNQSGKSLLFDFIETGSVGEKRFALEAVEKAASPKDLKRFQKIRVQEKDQELRLKLDEIINSLSK
ncbi:MAG: hypothetical protein QM496_18215 [Verrucomicrobiota bacterium]